MLFACQGPDEYFRNGSNTGSGAGGVPATGGAGNLPGTGGSTASSGGTSASGGVLGTGGVVATGGVPTTGSGGSSAGGAGGHASSGGAPGAGGMKATGGAAGAAAGGRSGGAGSGAAGSTGAGGAPAIACTSSTKLCIEANCADPTKANPQQFTLQVDVLNNSSAGLSLSDVTFRYWFTLGETTDPPVLEIDYWMYDKANITSKFVAVSPAVNGANEYLEVGFKSAAPMLALFSDSTNIQLRVHAMNYSSMFDTTQPTDYSFQKCMTGQAAGGNTVNPAPTITGYVKGVLTWGAEPQ